MKRFLLERAAVFCVLLCVAATGAAQNFPSKPIRLIVQFGAGGATDVTARLIAQYMGPELGQSVVVENRGGGGGMPAIAELIRAEPDGHTLMTAEAGQWAILPAMRSDLPYDPVRDFVPIGMIFQATPFIVVRDSLGVNTLKELIALAKAKPGALSYGTPALGGVHHIAMETLKASLGLDIQNIAYKGAGQTVEALLRGDVPIAMSGVVGVAAYLQSGKVKLLAYPGGKRGKEAPDVPTVAEVTGLQDFNFEGQCGLVAPRGTPRSIADKLSAALAKAAANPDLVARTSKAGIWMTPSGPDQLAQVIREDIQRYAKAIKITGITQ